MMEVKTELNKIWKMFPAAQLCRQHPCPIRFSAQNAVLVIPQMSW